MNVWINSKSLRRRGPGCGCVDKSKEEEEEGSDWIGCRERGGDGWVVDVWINTKRRRRRRGPGWL